MSTETISNGRVPRKSLASQLDRLDTILDGLADALQGAVADAVREALAPAVRDAVREAAVAAVHAVLANSDLRQHLTSPDSTLDVAAQSPEPLNGIASRAGSAMKAAARGCSRLVRRWLGGLASMTRVALRLRRPLTVAAGVGVALAVGGYLAGPAVASALGGLAGFGATLTASALRAMRRVGPGKTPHP
jgi:hypothetical protein